MTARFEIIAGRDCSIGDVVFAQGAVVGVLEVDELLPRLALQQLIQRGHYSLREALVQEHVTVDGTAGRDRGRDRRPRPVR